eukprot:gene10742-14427_t
MDDDSSYSPDKLEQIIDDCRRIGDWSIAIKSLERYAHVFDVGAATSTIQHQDLGKVRAYYWTCMAEYVYNIKKDVINAIDCVRRAFMIDESYFDIRIITSFMLLELSKDLINHKEINYHKEGFKKIDDELDLTVYALDLNEVLGKDFEDIPKSEQIILNEILNSCNQLKYKQILLSFLSSIPDKDALTVINEVLREIRQVSRPTYQEMFKNWILYTSKTLLSSVKLSNSVYDDFLSGQISSYRLWLWIDGISTRGNINEILQEPLQARNDAMHIALSLLPYQSISRNPTEQKTPTSNDQFLYLPEFIQCQALVAISRIPLIEMNMSMLEDAILSFQKCISTNSPIRNIIPIPLVVGLSVEASILHLKRAKIEFIVEQSQQDDNKSPLKINEILSSSPTRRKDSVGTNNNDQNEMKRSMVEVDIAYALLLSVKQTMSVQVDVRTTINTQRLYIESIEPVSSSQLHLLPIVPSDPKSIVSTARSSFIATLMAAILIYKMTKGKGNTDHDMVMNMEEQQYDAEIIELFQWGLSLEIKPDINLLWNLSCAYDNVGKTFESINLARQCHTALMEMQKYNNNIHKNFVDEKNGKSINKRLNNRSSLSNKFYFGNLTMYLHKDISAILHWLGLEHQISDYPWLGITKAVELSYDNACLKPQEDQLLLELMRLIRTGLIDLYSFEQMKPIFVSIGIHFENAQIKYETIRKNKVLLNVSHGLGDKYNNNESDLECSFIFEEEIDEGLYKLLFLLGKTHLRYSRFYTIHDYDRMLHQRVAVKVFALLLQYEDDFIVKTPKRDKSKNDFNNYNKMNDKLVENRNISDLFIYPTDDLLLYYCLSLADLRQFETATQLLYDYLSTEGLLPQDHTDENRSLNNEINDYENNTNDEKSFVQTVSSITKSMTGLFSSTNASFEINKSTIKNSIIPPNPSDSIHSSTNITNNINISKRLHLYVLLITASNNYSIYIIKEAVGCIRMALKYQPEDINLLYTLLLLEVQLQNKDNAYQVLDGLIHGLNKEYVKLLEMMDDDMSASKYQLHNVNNNNNNNSNNNSNNNKNNNNNNNNNIIKTNSEDESKSPRMLGSASLDVHALSNDSNDSYVHKSSFPTEHKDDYYDKNNNNEVRKQLLRSNSSTSGVSFIISTSSLVYSENRPSLLLSKRVMTQLLVGIAKEVDGLLHDIAMGGNAVNNHKIIDTLKYVPTLLGWRLPTGCGWGYEDGQQFYDCYADILSTYGLIIQKEEKNICSKLAIELFSISLTLCPDHLQSLLALIDIEIRKFQLLTERQYRIPMSDGLWSAINKTKKNLNNNELLDDAIIQAQFISEEFMSLPVNTSNVSSIIIPKITVKEFRNKYSQAITSSKEIVSAYNYSRLALLTKELSAEVWLALGRVSEMMGDKDQPVESYMTSLECRQYSTLRPFDDIIL